KSQTIRAAQRWPGYLSFKQSLGQHIKKPPCITGTALSYKTSRVLLFQVEPVKVHHFGPGGYKILHKFILSVSAAIYFSNSSQFCIRSKYQVSPGCGPFSGTGSTVCSFVQ